MQSDNTLTRPWKRVWAVTLSTSVLALCIWFLYLRHNAEGYSLSKDVTDTERYLRLISSSEEECYQRRGTYLSDETLAQRDCVELAAAVTMAKTNGYQVELWGDSTQYAVRVTGSSRLKGISLYSDRSGLVRLGTRDRPATANSAPLHD